MVTEKKRRVPAVIPPLTQAALASRLRLAGWEISRAGAAKIEIGIREVTDIEFNEAGQSLAGYGGVAVGGNGLNFIKSSGIT